MQKKQVTLLALYGATLCNHHRMKQDVSNPYHLWAHQAQDSARNSSRNRSFSGVNAYSYSTVIATIATNMKGEKAYIVAPNRWSVTTAKHLSEIWRAIPNGETIFYVPNVLNLDHKENVAYLVSQAVEFAAKAKRARTNGGHLLTQCEHMLRCARNYVAFFDVTTEVPTLESLADAVAQKLIADKEASAANREHAKRAKEARAQAEKERRERAMATLPVWLSGESNYAPYYLQFAYMRLKGDIVQTTRGADVPAEHVRKIAPLMKRLVSAGKAWTPDGDVYLGPYRVTGIDANGVLTVGCHRFEKAEVLRFAQVLGA